MLEVHLAGRTYRSHAPVASDLAIPLAFDGTGPQAFGAMPASLRALASPGFSARVAAGASCNASVLEIAPHGNGTHTETVAHLCESGPDAATLLTGGWLPAWLASVDAEDGVITFEMLQEAIERSQENSCLAFLLRTRPNDTDKLTRDYDHASPPWLDPAVTRALAEARIEHLLVDLPSLDRMDDPELPAHHAFFGLPAGSRNPREAKRRHTSVTEMIYAADELADGLYLLDLQVPRWRLEAVPSRPLVAPAQLVEDQT